ncbi:MAG: hypothetical protein J2P47_04525, partial [Acetobacteraceae bacterium]|nr:hypothetical protein [Acetobacteraceae bacterium]
MRYLLSALLAAGVLAAPHAEAAQWGPADQPVFDLQGLKSQLMVLASGCPGAEGDYNAFVTRFRPALTANDAAMAAYFRRAYGRRAQREQDAFITNLANAQSEVGLQQGSEFCPRNEVMFREVMSLADINELPEYAAGKAVIPSQMMAPAPAAAAPHATAR